MRTRRDAEPLTPEELIRIRRVLPRLEAEPDFTPDEVAAILGISTPVVLRHVRAGDFPGAWQQSAKVVRIPPRALDAFRAARLAYAEARS